LGIKNVLSHLILKVGWDGKTVNGKDSCQLEPIFISSTQESIDDKEIKKQGTI
jgi:hypothetical protein